MKKSEHDTLVVRLAQVLVKLNQGERLDPIALAEEFGVNMRTIQRDLNERFAYLPLIKTNGKYHLDPAFLGKLNTRDIERFACLAGVRGLFPSLSDDFLRDIFDTRMQSTFLVKGHNYEDLAGKEQHFKLLEQAITGHRKVSFLYQKEDGPKSYVDVEPYKLVNNKGIWYLAGKDGDKLKTFSFTKIESLSASDQFFKPQLNVSKALEEEDGIWISDSKKEIVLKVSSEVAPYFKRRKLIANQVIEKELEDGGLIVSCKVGHENQVIPIVRYWIPHIKIINPEELQDEVEDLLRTYIKQ